VWDREIEAGGITGAGNYKVEVRQVSRWRSKKRTPNYHMCENLMHTAKNTKVIRVLCNGIIEYKMGTTCCTTVVSRSRSIDVNVIHIICGRMLENVPEIVTWQ
jgi:hypothetical protein